MPYVLATLPLHLALQLTITGNYSLENITLPAEKPLSQLSNGYSAFPDIAVAMKYYTHKLPWNSARKHCILDGGNLAVIDSLEKGRYANSVRKTNPLASSVSMHKLFDNLEWVSAKTGLAVNFIPWTVDANRTAPAPYSCAVLWST